MAKGRIRTTMQKDYFGTGNEKEITMDDGRVYRIKSTMQKDYFGNGQELEIYEVGKNSGNEFRVVEVTHSKTLSILQCIFKILALVSLIFPFIRIFAFKDYDVSILCWGLCIFVVPWVFIYLSSLMGELDYDLYEKKNERR